MKVTAGYIAPNGERVQDRVLDVEARKQAETLRPGREEFRRLPGYRENKQGTKWRNRAPLTDGHGHFSKLGGAVGELMGPYWKAKTEIEAKERGFPGEYGVTSKAKASSGASLACPRCGFNRMMGRCTCEEASSGEA